MKQLIKNFKNKGFLFVNKLCGQIKLVTLKPSIEYGYIGDIVSVDQLCSPDSSKVFTGIELVDDVSAAKRFGTDDTKEYSFWARRSCGVAIVVSILKALKGYDGTIYDLVKKLDERGGYIHENDIGWKHQALLDELLENNIVSRIVKKISSEGMLAEISKGNMFVASVKSRVTGTHMLLCYKFVKENISGIVIYVMDPWDLDGKGGLVKMRLEDFSKKFLHRGILIKLK